MLGGHVRMTGLAMGHGFLEMFDAFIQMRILHTSRLGMFEGTLGMLHQGIGMSLLAMRHSFLGMLHRFIHMFVIGKGQPTEQREANKRGNRCNDQCSAMSSHFHGFLLSG
jgi:hypothetical protein